MAAAQIITPGTRQYRSVRFAMHQKWKMLLGREKLIVYK
jgi:hypothetical protein